MRLQQTSSSQEVVGNTQNMIFLVLVLLTGEIADPLQYVSKVILQIIHTAATACPRWQEWMFRVMDYVPTKQTALF